MKELIFFLFFVGWLRSGAFFCFTPVGVEYHSTMSKDSSFGQSVLWLATALQGCAGGVVARVFGMAERQDAVHGMFDVWMMK
ncbi:hypothetical protein BC936DRAFT_147389 [Jimgerdemannia flammicorona]|uniref:Uncharacterized protein n=1 Tax=Jimgerdemannia flammicorona TaxID=994334 RepID=A0A433D5G3_9FUNG|nr:hypothetical protein BC936DRAFT_147389 [Jimgerdemannia flammicorona]